MTWLAVLSAVLAIVRLVLEGAQKRGEIDNGTSAHILGLLGAIDDKVSLAISRRAAVTTDLRANPDRVREHDANERRD